MATQTHSILYWFAKVDQDGELTFHLMFRGEQDDVTVFEADTAMSNAKDLHYPVICIN